MKVICTQENLKNGISTISRIVNQSLSLPILGNLLLKTSDGVLIAQSTNLEQAMVTEIRCKIEDEGKVCVPSKLFMDLINSLPSQNITLETNNTELSITCGKIKSKIKTLPTDEFPVIPEAEDGAKIELPAKEFAKSLQQVIFATSVSESQPEISGVLFRLTHQKLLLVATDRYRLAEKYTSVSYSGNEISLIVPRKTAEEFLRLANSQNSGLTVYFGDNQISLKTSETTIVSRVIDGQYPEYEPIIPTNFDLTVSLSREKFLSAIKTVSIFGGSSNTIKMHISRKNKEVVISSLTQEFGDGEVAVEAEVEGEDMDALFNYRYVSDMLNSQDAGEIEVMLVTPVMPVILRPLQSESFRYLVMPIKN